MTNRLHNGTEAAALVFLQHKRDLWPQISNTNFRKPTSSIWGGGIFPCDTSQKMPMGSTSRIYYSEKCPPPLNCKNLWCEVSKWKLFVMHERSMNLSDADSSRVSHRLHDKHRSCWDLLQYKFLLFTIGNLWCWYTQEGECFIWKDLQYKCFQVRGWGHFSL